MQIAVANRNKDYQWLIQNAGFNLAGFAKYMAQRPACDANLQLLVNVLKHARLAKNMFAGLKRGDRHR